ncbi:hypothetical protein GDO78_010869 [Eleutherodactylus coqui]|uniref:Uncharacterized protein n=1 Tax=Eleutherodactylus coqui TaxID=57060 RepID=A0A8J6KAT2_ELECQ|nr:hypothetical protein GDO78_010869 [Eleutherodactylus coqui]
MCDPATTEHSECRLAHGTAHRGVSVAHCSYWCFTQWGRCTNTVQYLKAVINLDCLVQLLYNLLVGLGADLLSLAPLTLVVICHPAVGTYAY